MTETDVKLVVFVHDYRLSRHRTSKLDHLIAHVPKPRVFPPHSICMPRWKELPVDQKLPLLPGPPDAVFFCRGRLGQNVRIRIQFKFHFICNYV